MPKIQRMEVGADWSHTFLFKGGSPRVPLAINGWTLEGKASITELEATTIDLAMDTHLTIEDYVITEDDLAADPDLVVGQEVQVLRVALSDQDTTDLGVNTVTIQIRRTAPRPLRPILRMQIVNHEGY